MHAPSERRHHRRDPDAVAASNGPTEAFTSRLGLFEERGPRQAFFSAPQSVSSLVAALLEPASAAGALPLVHVVLDEPFDRPSFVLCLLVFALLFPGRNRFRDSVFSAGTDIAISWATWLLLLGAAGWATGSFPLFAPDVLLAWAVVVPLLQFAGYGAGRTTLRLLAERDDTVRRAVVVGAGPLGVKLGRSLVQETSRRIRLAGLFDDRGAERLGADALPHLRGRLNDVAAFVDAHGVHEVYITLPLGSQPRIAALLAALQDTTASIYFVPDVFGIGIIQGRLQDIGGIPVVGLCETPFTGTNELVKRSSDVVIASLILLAIAPLLAALAIAIRLDSPGPAIFRQRRNGLDGREIEVWKFRTMHVQEDGPIVVQARRDDPRLTRIGGWLRRTSLDELPQFINVLQGRMSIVGPRPHAVAHNEVYRQIIRAYTVRHKVRPGITGWAQVNGLRGQTQSVDQMRARVELDLEYLRNWSLGLDLQIIARTVRLLLRDRHAF